jgi:nitric oxide reductase subunit B
MTFVRSILATNGPAAVILIRLIVGGVFLSEGVQKFLYWYARSSEFLQSPLMQNLRWMRVPGDTIYFLGAAALVLFVAGLKTGQSFKRKF